MSEKPKFGVGADTSSNVNNVATEKSDRVTQESTGSASQKPSFGTGTSSVDDTDNTNRFGTGNETDSSQKNSSFLAGVLKLQTKQFWIAQYVISAIILLIFLSLDHQVLSSLIYVSNFILYPVTVTLFTEGARMLHIENGVTALFSGSQSPTQRSGAGLIIYWVIRVIVIAFSWGFSIILGIIGLIYMNHEAKKMGF